MNYKMKIVDVFQHDEQGFAVPTLNPDSEWVLSNPSALVTIKLDGILVRVEGPKLFRYLHEDYIDSPQEVLCSTAFDADAPLLAAFINAQVDANGTLLKDGYYEAFGPGIKGNPMKCEEPFMVCISPMTSGSLILHKAFIGLRFSGTVEEFYQSVKKELAESPEIEGLVFLLEDNIYSPKAWAKVERIEFGLPWPAERVAA